MPDRPPQVAIAGWYGSPNVGDEAALESILGQLARLPQPPRVVVLSSRPAVTAARYRHGPLPITVVPRSPAAPATCHAVQKSQLLILGGGGLIQDRSSLYNLLPYAAAVESARRAGVAVQWWGVGVEPLTTGLGRALARRMVAQSAPGAVSVRDAGSRDLLARAGVPPASVRVTADPVLALPPAAPAAVAAWLRGAGVSLGDGPHIAVCLRNLPHDPGGRGVGYLLPVQVRERLTRSLHLPGAGADAPYSARFFTLLAQGLDALITSTGVRVLFVPLWPGRDEVQAEIVRGQMAQASATTILHGDIPAGVLRALLGQMEAVIAVRLHALILAAAGGVPGLGFTYARKIAGFLTAIGLADHALDPATVDGPRLHAALAALWNGRAVARATVQAHVAALHAAAEQDLATAARLLGMDRET